MRYLKFMLIFILSLLVFLVLEHGRISYQLDEMVQPVIFAATLAAITAKGQYRLIIFRICLILLSSVVILYLLDQIILASWIGGLGFGMAVILIFSYSPKLIKDGHI